MNTQRGMSTKTMVMGAVLTALVIILQMMGAVVRFGPFSVSLVLVPIVIGAATCGKYIAAWLGFVFGMVVLLNGDAYSFLIVNTPGTIITVLLKGTACGFAAGACYRLLEKENRYLAVMAAAIVCPIVNTGIFLLGCLAFFMETVAGWAQEAGLGANVGQYMIVVLVGFNFLFEIGINILLSPAIVRLLHIRKRK